MQNLKNLDWEEILFKISQFATSEIAKSTIQKIKPLSSEDLARISFQEIEGAQQIIHTGIRPHMESLDFFSSWITRLKKKAVLKPLELKDVRFFCIEIVALNESLLASDHPWCEEIRSKLINAKEPLSAIDQIIHVGGEIRSDASEKLYQLTQEKERLERELHNTLASLVKSHQIENYLQDRFVTTREGRWVLPIKSGMQHFMPGVIHGSSQTKQTVFIEPEKVVPINNRLRQIDVEIEEEIELLLTQLSAYLATLDSSFENSRFIMESADVRFSQAQFAILTEAHPIDFSNQQINIIDVKHPLLQLSKKEVIPNSIFLDNHKSVLILSGLNAGGKTILLKSVGLAAQMARCGLLVSAHSSSKIPFFKEIIVSIGDSQNVDAELSTFAAHLKILNSASQFKNSHNLILIDEICGSTDPEEGSALARSFIETFAENNVFSIITSHLGPLKSGWSEKGKVINGSLEYNAATGKPTYHFISGIPGDSLAILTAKRVGVSDHIIKKAIEILSPESKKRLENREQTEKIKSEISHLQEELRKEIQKNQNSQKKYEQLIEEFKKEKNILLEKERARAHKKVEEAIALAQVEQTFKKHTALQEIKHKLPEIIKSTSISSSTASPSITTPEEFARYYPPGSKIYIPSLKQDGIIQSVPSSKGDLFVLSNSVRLQLNWKDLKPPTQPKNPTAHLVRQSSAAISLGLHDTERTLDLRGKTVDEAISEVEMNIDQAVQNHEDRIKIIHGHGTEALKKSVRAHLSRSLYVKKWKSAPTDAGGDGVTWVELGVD